MLSRSVATVSCCPILWCTHRPVLEKIWSAKELDAEFATMLAAFRDRETEHNWEVRDKYITRLRGILRGNAQDKYLDNLLLGVRQMVDGILKAVRYYFILLYFISLFAYIRFRRGSMAGRRGNRGHQNFDKQYPMPCL